MARPVLNEYLHGQEDVSMKAQFAEALRNQRLARGMSQEILAQKCQLQRTYLGAIERGEKAVSIEMASRLATGLDLPLSHLIAIAEALLG